MERKDISKIFHNTVGVAIAQFREGRIRKDFVTKEKGDYLVGEKPIYIDQKANADPSKITEPKGLIKDESAAKRFGATNVEEFSYWAWRACGITDIQMILKTLLQDEFKGNTMDLIRQGLQFDGYNTNTDVGWYHKSLVQLAQKYNLNAEMKKFVPSIQVASLIDQHKYVLCSVKSDFGGHIVLAYGYRNGDNGLEGLWINDPASLYANDKNRFISIKSFNKVFTHRVITVNTQNGK